MIGAGFDPQEITALIHPTRSPHSRPRRVGLAIGALSLFLVGISAATATDTRQKCVADCISLPGSDLRKCAQSCNAMQIDHRCLTACTGQGTPGSACLPSCSYISPDVLNGPVQTQLNRHNQFSAMSLYNPSTGIQVPAGTPAYATPSANLAPKAIPLGPSTNYKCVAACTQSGSTFGYCTQSCSY